MERMSRLSVDRRVLRVGPTGARERPDRLAVEEPLELRINGTAATVTMRTPGHDIELALGFLAGEGIIAGPEDVVNARHCADTTTYNIIDVTLAREFERDTVVRSFATTSACGVCGKESIEDVRVGGAFVLADDAARIGVGTLLALPDLLRERQRTFDRTGGLHAAALFDTEGRLLVVREDVGRHNAVDKVVGWALANGHRPGRGLVLQVSGRASFELVQKAYLAGIPMLSAVSAPSSLAVDLARDVDLTLAGFVRGDSLNLYSRPERVELGETEAQEVTADEVATLPAEAHDHAPAEVR